ncbi:hypothetical protein INS49_010118 [Diaporthe citri]|uniref:uncharacterized protein n=1 Tax=Diaporthe citri TaxID=83186 RepID=UPI001C80D558|nr:uncharacterized protein INS49_010118 [Diaporthe citri]KAG6361889.1 hypothetical protein INS49_010118 [Diaporthe citri]
MAPQTRSRTSGGAAQSSMDDLVTRTAPEASSKSSVAKKPKVYRRSEPAPKQLYFPARNKTVRTYGKGKARRSLPSKTPDQSTLTQIGWIPSTYQEEEDDMDGLVDLTMDDEDDAQKTEDRKTTRRSTKRRKTTGDLDTVPDSTAGSSFHTQTLTQMPSFMSEQQSEDDEVEDEFKFDDNEDENKVATRMPDSEKKLGGSSSLEEKTKGPTPSPEKIVSQPPHGTTPAHVSQTPRKQIVNREVIPSSQPSPFTPNLGIGERYWSQMDRTPLQERSTNVDAPTPTISRKRPRTLEIADSWSTVNGGMSSSPSRGKVHRTPLKEINLAEVAERSVILGETPARDNEATTTEEVGNAEVDSVRRTAPEMETPENRGRLSQKSTRPAENIILDSDDEFDFELEDDSGANDEAPGTPTPATRAHSQGNTKPVTEEAGALVQSPHKSSTIPSQHPATQRNSTPDPQPENEEAEPETPSPTPQRRTSISSIVEADKGTPLSSPQKTSPTLPPSTRIGSNHRSQALSTVSSPQKGSPAMPPVSQLDFRYKSQAFESQRVPFERIQQLGPQTDRSDIIVSVHPEHAEQITEGNKTHEFRNYRIPQTVGRIWIYITRPICALKYMATISNAKEPGQISYGDKGVGNEEFNEGKGLKFAYELKQVYELNNPVSLARMKENGWVEEAPTKYVYVPPAVLGELMGNLRRAIFVEPGEPQSSQADMSVSQEVEMQLRSDIAHSTQVGCMVSSPAHSQRRDAAGDADIIPSSQGNEKEQITSSPPQATVAATDKPVFAKPTVPASRSQRSVHWVEDSPVGRRAQQASQHAEGYAVRPSQATTASAPSSPSQRLPSYRGHPILISSQSQPSIPVSPPTKAAPPQMGPRSSGLVSDLGEQGEDVVVGDSPLRRRGVEMQSSSALPGSSQGLLGLGSGEPDSLLDDSRVRQPPEIVWDSEGEID